MCGKCRGCFALFNGFGYELGWLGEKGGVEIEREEKRGRRAEGGEAKGENEPATAAGVNASPQSALGGRSMVINHNNPNIP